MSEWDDEVTRVWSEAGSGNEQDLMTRMRGLVTSRPAGDPEALFEWASVLDFVGREAEAIPLYEAALENGLVGRKRHEALIQLSSSLRLVGRADEAAALLEEPWEGAELDPARAAFRALALRDAGDAEEALRVALGALAGALPQYGAAVARYAGE